MHALAPGCRSMGGVAAAAACVRAGEQRAQPRCSTQAREYPAWLPVIDCLVGWLVYWLTD